MNQDLDPQLSALFEQAAREPLQAGFVARLLDRVEAEARAQARRRFACLGVVCLVLLWQLPALLRFSAEVVRRAVSNAAPASLVSGDALSAWIISPAGWSASLLCAALLLWRARARSGRL